jgi:hypothetical protein
MYQELIRMAAEMQCTVTVLCEEIIECWYADRRITEVTPSPHGTLKTTHDGTRLKDYDRYLVSFSRKRTM